MQTKKKHYFIRKANYLSDRWCKSNQYIVFTNMMVIQQQIVYKMFVLKYVPYNALFFLLRNADDVELYM